MILISRWWKTGSELYTKTRRRSYAFSEAERVFKKFNVNGDGTIDKAELGQLLAALMASESPKGGKVVLTGNTLDFAAELWLDRADLDGSSTLSLEEFVRVYASAAPRSTLRR